MQKSDLNSFVANRIKKLRKTNNLTQKELAGKLGVATSTITNYETGFRSPNQEVLFELTKLFGVKINYFFPSPDREDGILMQKRIVGEIIKKRRKELGYNADYLSRELGVSRSTIFRYENGEIKKLPAAILDSLSRALKTSPAYLMGWDDENSEFISDNESLSIDEINLVNNYRKASEQNKVKILAYTLGIVDSE
ncbi:helix-turn-helix transcriptional regulator [Listeria monocytogenes]|uniref:helix-turn-helix domain-containing protein n=1 Tax=Listeria monocytogenes TaxID=1639 RepID=UPI0010F24262|nr:helix-turn-helix transcriptional regulator [Listeria monocytogenes]EAC8432154.1 XRE family transcriptional regulator [Listeria monocytogenes]EIZ2412610.1 helix-turn-helix transcriptional regulator [Listeria monocytogenes]EJH4973620.1 helix-turn-helix transcriptional regulator [Listeria monocytogenes]EJH5282770.1 helix-turn-helix transcriptional regulator [Listeria monocytogenes]EJH6973983.1 helix-turn-helix transcriptional regulator [Listeria monocytogenes]